MHLIRVEASNDPTGFIKKALRRVAYGPVWTRCLCRNGDVMEIRMRTNWPLIYWDVLRVLARKFKLLAFGSICSS